MPACSASRSSFYSNGWTSGSACVGHSFTLGGVAAPATPTVAAAGLLSATTGFAADVAVVAEGAACCAGAAAGAVAVPAGEDCAFSLAAFGAGRFAVFGTEPGGRGA